MNHKDPKKLEEKFEEDKELESLSMDDEIELAGTDPKQLQKELEELVKNKFGDRVQVVTGEASFDPLEDFEGMTEASSEEINLEFNYKPKEVKEYLDKFIIGQEEAKKTLAIAICDHYHHIQREATKADRKAKHYQKQNILMLGPTGVGKTYIIKKIAELIGVPFVKADATKFTEAGYVGANVEDTIRDLVNMANGNVELAQYGIVYIDEADKLAGSRRVAGRDISGRGVQNGFLKLLEETEVDTKNPFDMLAQMNSAISGNRGPKTINTKNILFIFSGAFSGLEDIIKKRLNTSQIGLGTSGASKKDVDFSLVTTKDLIDFGLEPELIGRLPVKTHCNNLTESDLYNILKYSEESIVYQYQDAFEAYGITIDFTDEALREIAREAFKEKTGARSLMTIIEKLLRDYKYELPSSSVDYVRVDNYLINNPQLVLHNLMQQFTRH